MGTIAKSDVELVEASRRGEHEAFGHLVARYQDVVCAVSYSSTGDRGLSEDVAQETFIAAWRQLDRLRDAVRLGPWLCGIARNLGRKAHKRRRREEPVDADEHVATGGSPFDATARGELDQVVRDALARVPAAYREVLVLYYREDQSIREVAATLGTSEAAATQRLSRGRRYLADSVAELVESSLRTRRPRRDLVAAVLAAIVVIPIPSRVDASPSKGSTMLKPALAASAIVAAGTTAYLVYSHRNAPSPAVERTPTKIVPVMSLGHGKLGLAHAPSSGPSSAPAAVESRSVAEADLGYLPADSDAVVGVNFAQVRTSALWQRFVAPQLAGSHELRDFEAVCGFDLLATLDSISIGLKGVGSPDARSVTGVIVLHGVEKTKATSCFDKEGVALAEEDGSKIVIDGDIVRFSNAGLSSHWALTFIDQTTALIVVGPTAPTTEDVARIAARDGTLEASSAFAATLPYINTDDSAWLMLSEQSPLLQSVKIEIAQLADLRLGAFYLSLNATDSLALDAGIDLGTPGTVARVVSHLQTKMTEQDAKAYLARFFDQFDVFTDGSDLIVSLAMSSDQISSMLMSM
jgi:RNA polymerase sigma factor (sigma-70 family)